MSINYAILGILSFKPQTGYDIKKTIQDSPFMPWSGNNNQIYKVLLELLDEGYVTNEVIHQEDSPSKKIYTITGEGLTELKNWILTEHELPEFKKMFLVQLAWSEQLSDEEVELLFTNYENTIKNQLLMQYENKQRGINSPERSRRERAIWESIYENIISTYENELNWIQKTRDNISAYYKPAGNRIDSAITINPPVKPFEYSFIDKGEQKYIKFDYSGETICSAQTFIKIIEICSEHNADCIIIQGELLNGDFRKLSTGIAAEALQKLSMYQINTAIIKGSLRITGKLRDLLNRYNSINVFTDAEEAENWLKIKSNVTDSNGVNKKIIQANNHNIAVVYSSKPIITNAQSAIDFFADLSYYDDCDRILLNKQSISEEFFDLSTGVAGEVLQKFVNYSKKLGVVGDFSMYNSNALKDFIYECNKGNNIFFVNDEKTAINMLSK